jgi:hypothetical protein
MSNTKPGWPRRALQIVLANSDQTTQSEYKFEDGEPVLIPIRDMEQLARRCELAAADVEVQQTILRDAENHVVQCQGELIKAQTLLERQQAAYLQAASLRKGVPCLT